MDDLRKPPKRPCGSCPYRRDVPPGVWAAEEYAKLPRYDGETWEQDPALFLCHQRDGCLCGGWLQTHDPDHLLALRIHPVDPSAFGYTSDVPVFGSGAEAALHGLSGVENPPLEARALMAKLTKMQRLAARAALHDRHEKT